MSVGAGEPGAVIWQLVWKLITLRCLPSMSGCVFSKAGAVKAKRGVFNLPLLIPSTVPPSRH